MRLLERSIISLTIDFYKRHACNSKHARVMSYVVRPSVGPSGVRLRNYDGHMNNQLTIFAFFTRESRMLRASLPSSGRLSVRPSVRPSHS